jgi:4-hydroxy-3-polyprenylbenzoate decarboxylase
MTPRKIALALSGASGAPYFTRLLQRLAQRPEVELHLVASDGGRRVLLEESGVKWSALDKGDAVVHANADIGASPASGSFRLDALVVVPCSVHTLCAVATGLADNLILRCAAVQLKERRDLIMVLRETPLSLPALRAMVALNQAGGVVMPASPGFYHRPQTVTDLVDTVVDRILDHLHIEDNTIKRWNP